MRTEFCKDIVSKKLTELKIRICARAYLNRVGNPYAGGRGRRFHADRCQRSGELTHKYD